MAYQTEFCSSLLSKHEHGKLLRTLQQMGSGAFEKGKAPQGFRLNFQGLGLRVLGGGLVGSGSRVWAGVSGLL